MALAHFMKNISTSQWSYDATKEAYVLTIPASDIGFTPAYSYGVIKVLRTDSVAQRFKNVICHYEIDGSGNFYLYSAEQFNGKVVLSQDE